MNNLPWDNNSWEVAAQIVARRTRQNTAAIAAAEQRLSGIRIEVTGVVATGTAGALGKADAPKDEAQKLPELLRATFVELGEKTDGGTLIIAAIAWPAIIQAIKKDWKLVYELDPRQLEEIVAGAYEKDGWNVELTPQSGDLGRDINARKDVFGIGPIRVLDQVKRYKPGHLVTAEEVRAMIGVLEAERATKALVSTTSDFAPRIPTDPLIARFIPDRMQLLNGPDLLTKLDQIYQAGDSGKVGR
jgi:restriction system protein